MVFLLLFDSLFWIKAGYKPYMYISPITERMRKRKAFADTELEESATSPHLFGSTSFQPSSSSSSSSVGNLTPSYPCLSIFALPQNGHLPSIIDHHALQQQTARASENDNTTEYMPTPLPSQPLTTTSTSTINDYQLSELLCSKSPSSSSSRSPSSSPFSPLSPQHKIRIIDDAKLMYMRRQINEPSLIYNPSTAEHNSECTNAKPKISFSIESIIGIK